MCSPCFQKQLALEHDCVGSTLHGEVQVLRSSVSTTSQLSWTHFGLLKFMTTIVFGNTHPNNALNKFHCKNFTLFVSLYSSQQVQPYFQLSLYHELGERQLKNLWMPESEIRKLPELRTYLRIHGFYGTEVVHGLTVIAQLAVLCAVWLHGYIGYVD